MTAAVPAADGGAPVAPQGPVAGHPEINWTMLLLGFAGMVVGQFMAILDIQIVAASLPQIQAGVGASADEISWIQTAYLIPEVVMIPLSGYLSRLWGTQKVFLVSCSGFLLMSIATGMSSSIEAMIFFRALQGLGAARQGRCGCATDHFQRKGVQRRAHLCWAVHCTALAALTLDIGPFEVDGQGIALAVLEPAHLGAGTALVVIEVVQKEADPGPADLAQLTIIQGFHGHAQPWQSQQGKQHSPQMAAHDQQPLARSPTQVGTRAAPLRASYSDTIKG